jgi:hypothetical protein
VVCVGLSGEGEVAPKHRDHFAHNGNVESGMAEGKMSEPGCATCSFRAKYDEKPKSFLGRVWRWHANFCPGWKAYMKSLPDDEKKTTIEKYNFPAGKFA